MVGDYVAIKTCELVIYRDYWLDFGAVVLKPLKLVRLLFSTEAKAESTLMGPLDSARRGVDQD